MDELTQLEKLFDNFRIVAQDGITVHGSLRTGYAVNTTTISAAETTGFPGGIVPPPPPTMGACCYDDGTCFVKTEADCTAQPSGSYQGDGTSCDPNPCQLCSGSVTLSKCGFPSFITGTRYFLTQTTSDTWHVNGDGNPLPDTCHASGSQTEVDQYTINPDGTCFGPMQLSCSGSSESSGISVITGCTGTHSHSYLDPDCTPDPDDDFVPCDAFNRCGIPPCFHHVITDSSETTETNSYQCDPTVPPCSSDPSTPCADLNDTVTKTLSNEYTTAMLIANTLALLVCPPGCSPIFTLGLDEVTCTAWCVFDV